MFNDKAINYFLSLVEPITLPEGIFVINPYRNENVQNSIKTFYNKFYNDNSKRIFIWGINPGRYGGGLTGIAFTDPVALQEHCGIENNLGSQKELSSKFIYEMIYAYGGVNLFFSECFLTAIYPLAIIKADKNYNYYDEPKLYEALKEEIVSSVSEQVKFGADRKLAVSLGRKNYKYLSEINNHYNFFDRIEILEHPRYIMQYKSRMRMEYVQKYLSTLRM